MGLPARTVFPCLRTVTSWPGLYSLTVAGAVPEWLVASPVSRFTRRPKSFEHLNVAAVCRPGAPWSSGMVWRSSAPQHLGMVVQMIGHEGLDEVIAVVIALLHAQGKLLSRLGGRG
jgi:hypothetical protein